MSLEKKKLARSKNLKMLKTDKCKNAAQMQTHFIFTTEGSCARTHGGRDDPLDATAAAMVDAVMEDGGQLV